MRFLREAPRYSWVELVSPAQNTVTGHDASGQEQITGSVRRRQEPPLTGVPHRANESILLSAQGLPTDYATVRHASDLISNPHRTFLHNQTEFILDNPSEGARFYSNLGILGDPENVANPKVVAEARRLRIQLRETIYDPGLDMFSVTAREDIVERTSFTQMRDRYATYRRLPDEEKEEYALATARELLRDPDEADKHLGMFAILHDAQVLSESGLTAQAAYENGIRHALEQVLDTEPPPYPTQVGMEHWVSRWATDTDTNAEFVLKGLIEQATTPEQITNLLYDVALAGLSTGNPDVMMRTSELIGWQTDLLTWQSSQGINLMLGRYSLTPEIRQRAGEIFDAFQSYFRFNSGWRLLKASMNSYRIHGLKDFQTPFARQISTHPAEMEAMGWDPSVPTNKIGHIIGLGGVVMRERSRMIENRKSSGVPGMYKTHGTEVGPLGEWLRDYSAAMTAEASALFSLRQERRIVAHLNFPDKPVTETAKMHADEASRQVYDHLHTASFDRPIVEGTYWNTLGLLVPEGLNWQKWRDIILQNRFLKQQMIEDQRHSLSPRGDHMEILNATLKELGFDSIDFTMDPQQKDITRVTLRVGNATFRCLLDRDYTFREEESKHNLGLRQHAPFLELVILSHLHQIYCAEPSVKDADNVETGAQREVEYRRAHRRVLPVGHNPRPRQILIAWDEYGISIPQINAERIAREEPSLITWVSQVKPEHVVGRAPVYNEGEEASKLLHAVLD